MGKGIKGLLILHFLNDGVRTTFVTLLPFIAKDLSLNLSAVGFLGSAQPLFASLLALPAGFFAGSFLGKSALGRAVDKFGNLKVFIISEICMAATLIILTLVPNFLLILFLSLLLGLFTRGTTPVIQAMFSEVSHKMHYNKIFALSEMFIGIAAVITVILMGVIADRVGITAVFYSAAFLAALATIPAFMVSRNQHPTSEVEIR